MPFISLSDFIKRHHCFQTVDIRDANLYQEGHLPNALSFPVHFQQEALHASLNTWHTNQNLDPDILIRDFSNLHFHLQQLTSNNLSLLLYDEAGGLYSKLLDVLLHRAGQPCALLSGGWQGFRAYQQQFFAQTRRFCMLTGKTGCGKTRLLQALKARGAQVIDLEALAGHKGSVFGEDVDSPILSTQDFHNRLWLAFEDMDPAAPVFIEQKGAYLGNHAIPEGLWQQLRQADTIHLAASIEFRISNLLISYKDLSNQKIKRALQQLKSKLEPELFQDCLQAIDRNDRDRFVRSLLRYYDQSKIYQLYDGKDELKWQSDTASPEVLAEQILARID